MLIGDFARLGQVSVRMLRHYDQSRLRMIEKESEMSADYVVKAIPAVRMAALTDTVEAAELEPHIGPMFDRVQAQLDTTGASLATAIATYAEVEEGMHRWAVENGYEYDGPCRELYLPAESEVQHDWVTELQ